jgi:acetyl esterase
MTRSLDGGLDRTRRFLAGVAAAAPRDLGVTRFREALRVRPELAGLLPDIALVDDLDADGVRVRRYDPDPDGCDRPVLVYLHGGAFVRGTLEAADPACRQIAARAGCVVLSVAYRLAPEHPFPAPLDDAEHVVHWAIAAADRLGIHPNAVSIGGDSAGATIAAVIARRIPGRIRLQVLLCGLFDLSAEMSVVGRASGELNLAREQGTLDWITGLYLPDPTLALNPDASPLLAGDHTGSPEAIVVTSELDPFAGQTREYVRALDRDGVPVTSIELAGLPHAFTNFAGVFPEALAVFEIVAAGVRRVGSPGSRMNGRPGVHRQAARVGQDLRGVASSHRVG